MKKFFSAANTIVGLSVALLTLCLWGYFYRPEQEPAWPAAVQGFSFSPIRMEQSPLEQVFPSKEEIEADLALLSKKAHAVRTYSMEEAFVHVPELAEKHQLNVTLGAWIDTRLENNDLEIRKLIDVAAKHNNVVRAIVGNEALLRGDVTVEELIPYLDKARSELQVPVSTAEPWHVWLKYPELAEHVDFIAVHMLPYWEGIHLDLAVDYIVSLMEKLKQQFPRKPIVISEVGWPSNGRIRGSAVASPSNEAIFLRRFLARAEKENYIYYVMEAFDQPWKQETEGAVGAYWGVYDVERNQKFSFTAPIVAIPDWQTLAGISVLIAAILLTFLLTDSATLKTRGRSFLAVIAYFLATIAVWIVYKYFQQYLSVTSIVVGILVLTGMVGVVVVILTEAHEWAEAMWLGKWRRPLEVHDAGDYPLPMVSLHVPTYNEPPQMVMETLSALSRLNYPAYEVIVVDNNTKDEAIWKPVKEHCAQLGKHFRFFHVDELKGFKAGALNFALEKTDERAEIIGVIDSDYVVSENWLSDLVPQFSNEKVAIVQAPQDYRDANESAFKAACYAEYRGFFFIGMMTRNERNAIIQHGTMTLVKKSVLLQVGKWAQWCITEDAELGLNIFEHGYEALYIPKTYGTGLIPDTFIDFKKQRLRWAYGSMQILRKHFSALFGRKKNRAYVWTALSFYCGLVAVDGRCSQLCV